MINLNLRGAKFSVFYLNNFQKLLKKYDKYIKIEGKNGSVKINIDKNVKISSSDDSIFLSFIGKNEKFGKAIINTLRSIINNAIYGVVDKEYEANLKMHYTGYKFNLDEEKIYFYLGDAKPRELIRKKYPGVSIEMKSIDHIKIKSPDKQMLFALGRDMRRIKKRSKYHKKGVLYENEEIVYKEINKK